VNAGNRTDFIGLNRLLKHEDARECAPVGALLSRLLPWCLLLVHGCAAPPSPRDASASVVSSAEVSAEPEAASEPAADVPANAGADEPSPPALLVSREPEPELVYLSPSRVGAAVRAHQADFLACQALADLEARRGPGSVTVGWLVEANGSVASVQLGRSSFASDRVNECVLSVAKSMSFPRSPMRTQVSWTVKFQGPASGPLAEAASPL